jgi:hypothetical protein
MIVRRATVAAPRTLAARIAKLEEARPDLGKRLDISCAEE